LARGCSEMDRVGQLRSGRQADADGQTKEKEGFSAYSHPHILLLQIYEERNTRQKIGRCFLTGSQANVF